MAANNGGWQWIASTGTDPAPYFQRLFNPMTQQRKFDPGGEYVRRCVPELRDVPEERLPEPWTMELAEQADGRLRHRARLPRADRRPRGRAAPGDRALPGGGVR